MKRNIVLIYFFIMIFINSSFVYIESKTISTEVTEKIEIKSITPVVTSPIVSKTDIKIEEEENFIFTKEDEINIDFLVKTLYGEYRGESKLQQAAVIWCILNRVGIEGFGDTIEEVVTQPYQFLGYNSNNPTPDYLIEITEDVYTRYKKELAGETEVGRILPKEYKWFGGNGTINMFRDSYENGNIWDWSLPNPYEKMKEVNHDE